jgi:hypothetical protein
MEDNLKQNNGRHPQKKIEDDLKKNVIEDEPINQNQPHWL